MVAPTSMTAVPRHRPGTWLRQTAEEAVLLDNDGNGMHRLNSMALTIWELCDGETTVEEIVSALCTLFSASPSVVARDVLAVFESFEEEHLIDLTETGERRHGT